MADVTLVGHTGWQTKWWLNDFNIHPGGWSAWVKAQSELTLKGPAALPGDVAILLIAGHSSSDSVSTGNYAPESSTSLNNNAAIDGWDLVGTQFASGGSYSSSYWQNMFDPSITSPDGDEPGAWERVRTTISASGRTWAHVRRVTAPEEPTATVRIPAALSLPNPDLGTAGLAGGWAMIVVVRNSHGVGQVAREKTVATDGSALTINLVPGFEGYEPFDLPGELDEAHRYYGAVASHWYAQAWLNKSISGRAGINPPPGVESVAASRSALTLELLPQLDPRAPLPMRPVGEVGAGQVAFSVRHQPTAPSGRADRVRLQVSLDGGSAQYWTGSAWSSTASDITVSPAVAEPTVAIPMTAGRSGVGRWWTREAEDGRWSPVSSDFAFEVVAKPVASAVVLDAPAESLTPTVTWAADVQDAYRVELLDAAGFVAYDSGVVASAARVHVVPARQWVNGGQYRARVTVYRSSGVASDAALSTLEVISWTPPTLPLLSAVEAREGVEVSAERGAMSTPASDLPIEVERWEGRWVPVAITSGGIILDVLAQGATAYRARRVQTDWVVSEWAYTPLMDVRRRCGGVSLDGVPLPIEWWSDDAVRVFPTPTLDRVPVGGTYAHVSEAAPQGQRGQFVWSVKAADVERVVDLLRSIVDVRVPRDQGPLAGELLRIKRLGDVTAARVVKAPNDYRYVTVDWVQQAPLTGDLYPDPEA